MLELEDFPLSDTDVMRVMVGGVVFLTSAAPIRVGVGLIANSQTLGITIGILWPTALETPLQAFLPDWVERLLSFEARAATRSRLVPSREFAQPTSAIAAPSAAIPSSSSSSVTLSMGDSLITFP